MHEDDTLLCVLCQRSEQTKITGALSTNDGVTAHQNCLLFASALICRNTPQFDDLFGFSVEDVLNEVKRGRQLICNKCKKRGATAGCEVRRCKKSYHYPCAVEERAEIVEDVTKEKYVLYCYKHYPKTQGAATDLIKTDADLNTVLTSGHNELTTLESLTQMGFDRNRAGMAVAITGNQGIELAMDWLMVHENDPGTDEPVGNVVGGAAVTQSPTDEPSIADPAEENNPSENGRLPLSSQSRAYRNPEEAGTSKNASGDSTDQRPTVYSSDSNSSIKRRLSFRDKQNGTPSKRKSKCSWASNSGDNELDSVMAPLDTDIDDSEHLVREPLMREIHFCLEEESRASDETIDSDAESESLLPPFSQTDCSTPTSPMLTPSEVRCKTERLTQTDDGGSLHMNQELELCAVSPEGSPVHSPYDPHTTGPSPSALTDAGSSACVTLPTSCSPPVAPPPHVAPPPDPSPSGASSRFWRSCNAAGCTQNIFIGFFKEMSDVSDRIQAEQASQEDYDLALTVMRASGKLLELVGNQQEELQGKQRKLQEAAAAMEEAVSALKRDEEQLSQSHTHHS